MSAIELEKCFGKDLPKFDLVPNGRQVAEEVCGRISKCGRNRSKFVKSVFADASTGILAVMTESHMWGDGGGISWTFTVDLWLGDVRAELCLLDVRDQHDQSKDRRELWHNTIFDIVHKDGAFYVKFDQIDNCWWKVEDHNVLYSTSRWRAHYSCCNIQTKWPEERDVATHVPSYQADALKKELEQKLGKELRAYSSSHGTNIDLNPDEVMVRKIS